MTTIVGMAGAVVFMVVAMIVSPNAMMVIVIIGISQFFFGLAFGLTTSLYATCATDALYKTNKNTTGFIMGLIIFSVKASVFLRGLMITVILGIIGYSAEMAMTEQAVNNLSFAFFMIPTVLIGLGIVPMLFFKMKDSDVIEMRKEIENRKAMNAN